MSRKDLLEMLKGIKEMAKASPKESSSPKETPSSNNSPDVGSFPSSNPRERSEQRADSPSRGRLDSPFSSSDSLVDSNSSNKVENPSIKSPAPALETKTNSSDAPKFPPSEEGYDPGFTPSEDSKESNILEFAEAGDFLSFCDPEIAEGRVTPYKWQYDLLREMSSPEINDANPYLLAMAAANGSGKDKYIIAPLAVWMLCCKFKARVVITTASGTQLTRQTEPYISQLCRRVNEVFGEDFIKIRQRHMTCKKTGSEIVMFATDEGGQAEGYHPWEKDTPLVLIVNEAKSVLPEIFQALDRCTGYTHQLYISSPGEPAGDFYKAYTSGLFRCKKITAFDCPHIKQRDIDKTAVFYGKSSLIFRSKVLAEFTSLGSLVVIPVEQYDRCLKEAKPAGFVKFGRRAGLDLAAGGDETVLTVFQGNKQIALEGFHTPDTVEGVDIIVRRLETWELQPEDVFADDGGIGRSIIDQIQRRLRGRPRFKGETWMINRVLNQSKAINPGEFGNRGAELYFNFQRLVQEALVVLMEDVKQRTQLISRKYKKGEGTGRFTLQSKKEARAEGYDSPDRADAVVLAFCGLTVMDFLDYKVTREKSKYQYDLGANEQGDDVKYSNVYTHPFVTFDHQAQNSRHKRCFLSLSRILDA